MSRALRGGPGAPGVSGAEWGAVAGRGGRAAGERSPGALHRLRLRSGAVSRDGMDLREGNGAHRQSAETLERRLHTTPLEAGPALQTWVACSTRETPVFPTLGGSREFGPNNWIPLLQDGMVAPFALGTHPLYS